MGYRDDEPEYPRPLRFGLGRVQRTGSALVRASGEGLANAREKLAQLRQGVAKYRLSTLAGGAGLRPPAKSTWQPRTKRWL